MFKIIQCLFIVSLIFSVGCSDEKKSSSSASAEENMTYDQKKDKELHEKITQEGIILSERGGRIYGAPDQYRCEQKMDLVQPDEKVKTGKLRAYATLTYVSRLEELGEYVLEYNDEHLPPLKNENGYYCENGSMIRMSKDILSSIMLKDYEVEMNRQLLTLILTHGNNESIGNYQMSSDKNELENNYTNLQPELFEEMSILNQKVLLHKFGYSGYVDHLAEGDSMNCFIKYGAVLELLETTREKNLIVKFGTTSKKTAQELGLFRVTYPQNPELAANEHPMEFYPKEMNKLFYCTEGSIILQDMDYFQKIK